MYTCKKQLTAGIALALMSTMLSTTVLADSTQSNKNAWRNLAIGSGVVAGYGLIHHNGTATVLGAAGAAYSLSRYEQDRKSQSKARRLRAERWYREHHRDRHYY